MAELQFSHNASYKRRLPAATRGCDSKRELHVNYGVSMRRTKTVWLQNQVLEFSLKGGAGFSFTRVGSRLTFRIRSFDACQVEQTSSVKVGRYLTIPQQRLTSLRYLLYNLAIFS